MKRSELAVLLLSLILGFAGTCFYAEHMEAPSPVYTEQTAWWGGLYPEYCLPGAMEAVETEDGGEKPKAAPVKIRFKYLSFLNH